MVVWRLTRSRQTRTRLTFTGEFKRGVACLVSAQGFSSREVCEQFDLQDSVIRRLVNQVKSERNGGRTQYLFYAPSAAYLFVTGGSILISEWKFKVANLVWAVPLNW